jgi:hypothetical protein
MLRKGRVQWVAKLDKRFTGLWSGAAGLDLFERLTATGELGDDRVHRGSSDTPLAQRNETRAPPNNVPVRQSPIPSVVLPVLDGGLNAWSVSAPARLI